MKIYQCLNYDKTFRLTFSDDSVSICVLSVTTKLTEQNKETNSKR